MRYVVRWDAPSGIAGWRILPARLARVYVAWRLRSLLPTLTTESSPLIIEIQKVGQGDACDY